MTEEAVTLSLLLILSIMQQHSHPSIAPLPAIFLTIYISLSLPLLPIHSIPLHFTLSSYCIALSEICFTASVGAEVNAFHIY